MLEKLLNHFKTPPDEVVKYVQPNSSNNCIHRYSVEILNIKHRSMIFECQYKEKK